jgi:hypothetical protein
MPDVILPAVVNKSGQRQIQIRNILNAAVRQPPPGVRNVDAERELTMILWGMENATDNQFGGIASWRSGWTTTLQGMVRVPQPQ